MKFPRVLLRHPGMAVLFFFVPFPVVALPEGDFPTLDDFTDQRTINLGPTGLRGWVAFDHGSRISDSRHILITGVDEGSPGHKSQLEPGDVILGASGDGNPPAPFAEAARRAFADAIAAAEASAPAILELLVRRDDKTVVIRVGLEALGAYSETAPFNCSKSSAILRRGLDHLFHHVESGRYTFGVLPLIAADHPDYAERVREEVRGLIPSEEERLVMLSDQRIPNPGKPGWSRGHTLIVLAEYYLATRDAKVLPAIEAYAVNIAKNHSMFGTSGHIFADKNPDGSNNGPMGGHYGAVNSAAMPCFLGLVLASKCPIDHPEIAAGIDRCRTFYGYFAGRGTIPYGEHTPYPQHSGNGKSGLAALCFSLLPDTEAEGRFFSKMSVAGAGEREIGHTGPYFNYLWSPLGANAGGPRAMAEHFRRISWHLDLCRRWDGSFVFNNLYGEGPHSGRSYHGFPMSTAALLAYAAPLRSLEITGRSIDSGRWLDAADIAAAAAADDYDPSDRTDQQLVADLGNWSPKVRDVAAKRLGKREPDPAILGQLQDIAADSSLRPGGRAGACSALGMLRHQESASLLAGLLTDPDDMVRYASAEALRYLPDTARRSVLDEILRATASTAKPLKPIDPDDPLHFPHGRLAMLLFYKGNAYGPKGILWKDISGVDRDLLFPAIRAVAETPIGISRSTLASVYPQLSRDEVIALAGSIIDSVRLRAPSDRMFSAGVRIAGLKVLQRERIAEGIPAAVALAVDENKARMTAIQALEQYSGAVRRVDHQPDAEAFLQGLTETKDGEAAMRALESIRNNTHPEPVTALKRIESTTAEPAVLTLPEASTSLEVEAVNLTDATNVVTWEKLEGPGNIRFSENRDPGATGTTATFDGTPGDYLIRVNLSDHRGLTRVSDTVRVRLEAR